jgi:hypothetical protein
MARGQWVYVGGRAGKKPSFHEKLAITAACDRLITEVLLLRYPPEIMPTEFNYPVGIYGKWRTLDEGPHARLLHLLNRTIGPCIIWTLHNSQISQRNLDPSPSMG